MALSGWNPLQKIRCEISPTDIPSYQENCPALINISAASGKIPADLTAVFAALGASGGLKVAVEDGDSGNQCTVELERYGFSGSSAQYWVKVPALSNTTFTWLNFYFDETQADNTTNVGVIGSTPGVAVWSNNYAHVYHLSQAPGGAGTVLDSLAAVNGTPTNMDSSDLVAAFVGLGLEFNGTDEHVRFTFASDYTTASVEISFRATTGTAGQYDGIFSAWDDLGNYVMSFIVSAAGAVGFYKNNSAITTEVAISNFNNWNHTSFTISPTADKTFNHVAGTSTTVTASFARYIDASSALSRWYNDTRRFPGVMRGLFISSVVRSDDWLNISYKSRTDNLFTYSFATAPARLIQPVDQGYNLENFFLKTLCAHTYSLQALLRAQMQQIYGLRMLVALSQRYGDVPAVRRTLEQYYGSAAILRRLCTAAYGDSLALRQTLDQDWILPAEMRAILDQLFFVAGSNITNISNNDYALKQYTELKKLLDQVWAAPANSIILQQPSISVTADGISIKPHHINIEVSESSYLIRGEIHLADQADFLLCRHLDTEIIITIAATQYHLLVEAPRKSRPEVGRVDYYVPCVSKTVLLDSPYADMVDREFSGSMVSEIVIEMAAMAGITVDWQLTDWFLPSGTLYANSETPLAVIRKIVSAVGGVIQSSPLGVLICRPEYPVSVPQWGTVVPDYYLTDQDNFFSVDSSPDIREGYNSFLISDQSAAQAGLSLEQRDIDATTKEILVYQVPWDDTVNIILHTSGGSWVSIVSEGVVTEDLTDLVEIIAGEGQTTKPIYAKHSHSYKQSVLGSITHAEDGGLTTELADNSLVEVNYATKYWKFRVTDPNIEDVQFFPEKV